MFCPCVTVARTRPRRRWVNNIKMDWIELAQDRDQSRALVGNEASGSIKCWEVLSSCTIGRFSRRAQLHEWVSVTATQTHSAATNIQTPFSPPYTTSVVDPANIFLFPRWRCSVITHISLLRWHIWCREGVKYGIPRFRPESTQVLLAADSTFICRAM
jgi:hypothetical protein